MRRAIRLMADRGSFFEIGSLWGTDQIVGFVRFNVYPMGVVASDCRHINGGALTADNIKMVAGAPMVVCPYCGTTYQLTEEPKW